MIAISLSPNTQADDVWLALKLLLSPWRWFGTQSVEQLTQQFKAYFGDKLDAVPVASGRVGEYLILKSLGIGKDDAVAVQAFNCVAVPNSVRWTGATPIYVDVDESFNMDPQDLVAKLTPNTRAIVVQHSFGIAAQINKLVEIAHSRGLVVIEDCAHALGLSLHGKSAGSFGDFAFFSFGRDKVISGVTGGLIVGKDLGSVTKIAANLPNPKLFDQLQNVLHPILFNLVILPTYNFGIGKFTLGKVVLVACQKLKLLSLPVTPQERSGKIDLAHITRLGSVSANLAAHQLAKLAKLNSHRHKLANIYARGLNEYFTLPPKDAKSLWLRYPVLVDRAQSIRDHFKRKGVLLGGWYQNVLEPAKDPTKFGYVKGSCPNAERLSTLSLNLPTNIRTSAAQARKLVRQLNEVHF